MAVTVTNDSPDYLPAPTTAVDDVQTQALEDSIAAQAVVDADFEARITALESA